MGKQTFELDKKDNCWLNHCNIYAMLNSMKIGVKMDSSEKEMNDQPEREMVM